MDHFTKSGLRLKDPTPKKDAMLAACLKEVDDAAEQRQRGFFCGSETVKVSCMNTWSETAPKFLRACRLASEMHSQGKRASATKDPLVEMGHHASISIRLMSKNALLHSPDLGEFSCEGQNKFPATKKKNELSDSLDWNDDCEELSKKIH